MKKIKIDIKAIRKKHFPLRLDYGFTVKPVEKKEVMAFLAGAYDKVFPRWDDDLCFRLSGERRKELAPFWDLYNAIHHEWFLFLDPKGRPVGWHMGEAEDFQTFYMRNSGILPEFQNRGLYAAFSVALARYLGELGYERISSHHKPTNRAILILKLKQGFDVSGFEMTENWGALVKVVKIIPEDRRKAYNKMFGDPSHLNQKFPRKGVRGAH